MPALYFVVLTRRGATLGKRLAGIEVVRLDGHRLSWFESFERFSAYLHIPASMFVGLIELLLEFVKPVTLAMRLFGNIYGGEVALGVMTALIIGIVPVALYFLEAILTFAQALIFSVLTLMFTLIAVESHDHDEGEMGHEAMDAVHDSTQAAPAAA